MLTILFIEDEQDSIKPILDLIDQGEPDINHHEAGFDEAEFHIKSLRPDIVVLDLWEGDAWDKENKGSEYLDLVWKEQFCPVIVHSAQPEIPDEQKNAFVKEITKGQNSPKLVLEAIHEMHPHVEALKGAEEHIRNTFSIAMRDVAPSTFDLFADAEQRNDAIKRTGSRRLAALMDNISSDGQKLASWEQYLCPPLSQEVLLGDILMKADEDNNSPSSFRVVLTPSCDLASNNGSDPKVSKALVSKCCPMKNGLKLTRLKTSSLSSLKRQLIGSVLSQGFLEAIIPFPGLQGRIPNMAANLRELELIPLDEIGLKDAQFTRIASLDSPFRELVSWAYIQISGRPGLPNRDFQSWCNEIVAVYGNKEC